MITLLVLILLFEVMQTALLLINIDKPEREIHPVAIEAVKAAVAEKKAEVKPKPKYRTWSEMRAKLEADVD